MFKTDITIKEIALKIARNMADFPIEHEPYEYQIKFAEALVAELAKENKPVYYLWENKYGDPQQMLSSNSGPHPEYVITALYPLPPTAEQIEQETAEAIAKLVSQGARDLEEEYGMDDMGGLSFGGTPHGEARFDRYNELMELDEAIRSGAWKEYK